VVQGVRPAKTPIYFNIKLLIHVQGPIIESGQTPSFCRTPDEPLDSRNFGLMFVVHRNI